MTDKLIFKDFIGTVHFSTKDSVFYGKIEGINDLITFEGESVSELKSAFEEAVDDYIALCKRLIKNHSSLSRVHLILELTLNFIQKHLRLPQ